MKIKEITKIILEGLLKVLEEVKGKIVELEKSAIKEGAEKKSVLDEFTVGLIYKYIIQPINFYGFDGLVEPT